MSTEKSQVKIRPMVFLDMKGVFALDQQLRTSSETPRLVTYKDLATQKIFGLGSEKSDSAERANIMLETAKLVDLGLVAEDKGTIIGFALGRQTYLAERDVQEGEIAIFGLHPDYRGKGIGAKLVNALCDLFRSRGVRRVRIGIEPLDKELIDFVEELGFKGQRLAQYTKTL